MASLWRKFTLVSVVLFACIMLGSPAHAQPSDQCKNRFYYADVEVGWCIPSDSWALWASYAGGTDEQLDELVDEFYGIPADELYTLGGTELVTMLIHEPVDRHAVYMSLFRVEMPSGYDSPEDLIEDIDLDGEVFFTRSDDCLTPCGVAVRRFTTAQRQWVVYPLFELDLLYFVVGYGPDIMVKYKPNFRTYFYVKRKIFYQRICSPRNCHKRWNYSFCCWSSCFERLESLDCT